MSMPLPYSPFREGLLVAWPVGSHWTLATSYVSSDQAEKLSLLNLRGAVTPLFRSLSTSSRRRLADSRSSPNRSVQSTPLRRTRFHGRRVIRRYVLAIATIR